MMLLYQEAHSLKLDNRKSFNITDLYFDRGFNTIVRTPRDSVKLTAQLRKGIKYSSEVGLLEYYISLGYKTNTYVIM